MQQQRSEQLLTTHIDPVQRNLFKHRLGDFGLLPAACRLQPKIRIL
jgi:hypothetical protein